MDPFLLALLAQVDFACSACIPVSDDTLRAPIAPFPVVEFGPTSERWWGRASIDRLGDTQKYVPWGMQGGRCLPSLIQLNTDGA
jgi:hypothetical protein